MSTKVYISFVPEDDAKPRPSVVLDVIALYLISYVVVDTIVVEYTRVETEDTALLASALFALVPYARPILALGAV